MKHYLSQVILNKKINYLFLFFILYFGLLFPLKPACAIFGLGDIGLLDLPMMQLEALDFGEGTILQLIFLLMLLLIESQAFLLLSARLFQWAIDFPINLGITSANPLVTSGWQFTSGLVNAFLILIFVIVALAYILRIETFRAKKALPRLIIVALLINFSLVFIAIGVDVAQIILKSITSALGSNLPRLAIEPFVQSLNNLILGYSAILATYTVFALIPFANVAGIVALIAAFIAEAALGVISLTILLIILGFGLGSIFFLYFVFFIIRVSMIWMLAILSPLAFAAAILPNTRKYWNQWLGLLLEWLFFGVIVVLLAGLGLKLFAESDVVSNTGPILVGPLAVFPAFTYNYLFLLIYLGLVFYYSKTKFAPELADVLISQGKGLVKRGAPIAAAARKGLETYLVKQEEGEKRIKARKETGVPLTMRERFGAGAFRVSKTVAAPVSWAYRRRGVTAKREVAKDVESKVDEFEKRFGTDIDSALKTHGGMAYRALDTRRKAALPLYLTKVKGEEGINKLSLEQQRKAVDLISTYAPEKLQDFVKYKKELKDDDRVGGIITRKLMSRGLEDSAVKRVVQANETIEDGGVKLKAGSQLLPLIRNLGTQAPRGKRLYDKLIDRALELKLNRAFTREDANNFSRKTVADPKFLENAVRYGRRDFIRRLLETYKLDWNEVHEQVMNIGIDKVAKNNPSILAFPYTSGGRMIGAQPFDDRAKINSLIARMKTPPERLTRDETDRLINSALGAIRPAVTPPAAPGGRPGPRGRPPAIRRGPLGGRRAQRRRGPPGGRRRTP